MTDATTPMETLFSGEVDDPHPLYAEIRESGDGIHWTPGFDGYMVTRYDDVRHVASDPATFSSDMFSMTAQGRYYSDDAEQLRFQQIASNVFMKKDPPVHTRIRSAFRHVFTPAAIQRWRPQIERLTKELIGAYPRGEEFNIMPGFAADIPVAVIAEILGVPAEARSEFRTWSEAYTATFDPAILGPQREEATTKSLELFDYLGKLVSARRQSPADDLITVLVESETTDGDRLTTVELIAQVALLLVAGNETTTGLIGAGLTALFDNPDERARLEADMSLVPSAIEEMLRYEPSLHFITRKTTKEVVIGNHTLPPDTLIYLSPAAANRDPRRFTDPDRFDITRPDNKHLTFLHGIHFCVGAPLARTESEIVFTYILRNFPDVRPGVEPAKRRRENVIAKGWANRPVIL